MTGTRSKESLAVLRAVAASAVLCLPVAPALAGEASSESYVLESSTTTMLSVSAGSETYAMVATVGQPVEPGPLSGGSYTADVGFLNDLDADGDGVLASLDLCPTQFSGCNDINGDGCIDTPDTDADGDGVGKGQCDCEDGNGQIWTRPGEVINVRFTNNTTLGWNQPAEPGGTSPRYDLIRSQNPRDFVSAATCVESDDSADTTATDTQNPATRSVLYYLVRAENSCASGVGPLGASRGFLPRTARTCP
jgi:hypothetical protein